MHKCKSWAITHKERFNWKRDWPGFTPDSGPKLHFRSGVHHLFDQPVLGDNNAKGMCQARMKGLEMKVDWEFRGLRGQGEGG